MIKYEDTVNKYLYDTEEVNDIIETINNTNYYKCTREEVELLMNKINKFISDIKIVKEKDILERHETEEEAREYFGEDFIQQFNSLLTELDKQDTIVSIHGTDVGSCPSICDEGLMYKSPNLTSTSVQQHMEYGQKDMDYSSFETLLNWPHKEYKGLVLIAVPYESYYKEGLWNHYQEGNNYSYDYKINPDFIAGYIDVENKKIVLNPKYNRDHDYSGLVHDRDIFREQVGMDNDTIRKAIVESEDKYEDKPVVDYSSSYSEDDSDVLSDLPYRIDELIGTFNSVKLGFPDGMNEDRYKSLLEELDYKLADMKKCLPQLQTQKEKEEMEEKRQKELEEMFSNPSNKVDAVDPDFDFDWDDPTLWSDNGEWDTGDEINKFY